MTIDLFSSERFFSNIPKLIRYFPITLEIVLISEVIGAVIGLIIAMARVNRIKGLRQFFAVYVSFMRGTPMLVQLLLVFYGVPILVKTLTGFELNASRKINYVIIAYTLNQGAFISEIIRSAILSIPTGQTEAAYSVGMTKLQAFFRIISPQALRVAIPAFGHDFIALFQNTSLAFLIGVIDMMGRARSIGTSSGHVLEAYLFVLIVFVSVSLLLRFLLQLLEKRLAAGVRS